MKIREVHRDEYTISTDNNKLDVSSIHKFLANETDWANGIPINTLKKLIENSLNFDFIKKMKKCFYIVFISLLTFSCKKLEKSPSRNNNLDSIITVNEDKKILSKIINSFNKTEKIVITEQTTIDGITEDKKEIEFENFNYRISCLNKETFDDFIIKNLNPTKIKNDFHTEKIIIVLNNKQIKEVLNDFIYTGWKNFHQTYGQETPGILTLSRIGYNKKKNKALIYYSNLNGGHMLVLNKIENEWEICSSSQIWIS